METQHVRYFLAICNELNFTRAAQKCGIAQPSLTTAIQRMEREIGGALFLRSTRATHVQLTTLGLQLLPICVQMNNLMEEARSLVSQSENCRMVASDHRSGVIHRDTSEGAATLLAPSASGA
jgi:DNA-binding transcriptional LysR family regulator